MYVYTHARVYPSRVALIGRNFLACQHRVSFVTKRSFVRSAIRSIFVEREIMAARAVQFWSIRSRTFSRQTTAGSDTDGTKDTRK